MKKHNCDECAMRLKYDRAPKSLMGRFWRWHIRWCPGWKAYLKALDEEKKEELKLRYKLVPK